MGDLKNTHASIQNKSGKILRTGITETGRESVEWVHLAQNRNKWQALVNTSKLSGSIKHGKFLE
jgi:hypothetical protein